MLKLSLNPLAPLALQALLLLALAGPAAAQPLTYTIRIQDTPVGRMQVTQLDDATVEVNTSYRDNGRGPDLRERYTLGPQGVPVRYSVQGRSTYDAEIREDFELAQGRLRWTSRVDQGDEAVAPGTLFLPLESSLAYTGQVVQSLLQRAGGAAPVVGGHRLVAQRLVTTTPPGAPGPVTLVAVTGATDQPWYLWHRADDPHTLVGEVEAGWQVLLDGYEAAAPALLQRQQQAQEARLEEQRQRLARPLPGLTLVRAVRWFDAPAARMRGPSDVWLAGGRITAVTEPGALAVAADHVIDGRGRSLLPGLFDMHGHVWSGMGLHNLAAGVTVVRDMAGDNTELARLQGRLARGELAGPTLLLAGFIEGKSPFSSRNGFVVDSLEAAKTAVDWYAARGLRVIKLYNSIKPEWVRPLAAHAHRRGLRVAGHVPAFMSAEAAVRDGYDELTHINQLMLNFVSRPGDDSRTLLRFTRVGDDAHTLQLDSPQARRFIRLLQQRGTAVDLTVGTFEAMFTQRQGQLNPSLADVAEHLPAMWRRSLKLAEMDLEGPQLQRYRASYQRMLQLTAALHRAGVTLVAGTDALPGLGLHRELALYVQAGIPAGQALRTATYNAARLAGEADRRGRIQPGLLADLVLVDGDPTKHITDLRRASLVIQGEVAYVPAELYEAIGYKPFVAGAVIEAARSQAPAPTPSQAPEAAAGGPAPAASAPVSGPQGVSPGALLLLPSLPAPKAPTASTAPAALAAFAPAR